MKASMPWKGRDWAVVALGTGLFLGLVPPRTATLATALGIPLAIAIHSTVGWFWYLPVLAVLWAAGIGICGESARLLGRADPREVTYDEVVSLPLVYFLIPEFSWQYLLAGFCLHRFFDILKPLGISKVERLKGGLGIMADDILASLYALFVLHAWIWIRSVSDAPPG